MLLVAHPPWLVVPLGYLAAVSVPLAVTDVRTHRLPNALVVPGLVLLGWALLGCVVLADFGHVLAGLAGGFVVAVVLGAGWMLGGVGMGDVKLGAWLGGTAGMMGVLDQPGALAHGLVVGAVVTAGLLAGGIGPRNPSAAARFAFGPTLLAAFWAAVCFAGVHVG